MRYIFKFSNVTMKYSILYIFSFIFSLSVFADNENYDGQDVSGLDFRGASYVDSSWIGCTAIGTMFSDSQSNSDYSNSNFTGADLTNANLSGGNFTNANFTNANLSKVEGEYVYAFFSLAIFTNADFTNSIINGRSFKDTIGFTTQQLESTLSFKNKDLSYISPDIDISSLDLTDFNISGTNFGGTNLRAEQLYSTANYKNKNLRNVGFYTGDYSGWNFVGQNLQNTHWKKSIITNADATGADLRGASFPFGDYTGEFITKNTIMSDGVIQNFSMKSSADSLIIREHVPEHPEYGDYQISAKIAEDADISGGARLALEEGAKLEVLSGQTLTVASSGILAIHTDAAASTTVTVDSSAALVFENGAVLEININCDEISHDVLRIAVMDFDDGARIAGLDALVKGETVLLNVNGSEWLGEWDYALENNQMLITVAIPEPAVCAAAIGAVGLLFAALRKRR